MSDTSSDSDGYPVEISITNSNDKLWLGMTAKCSIILNEEKDTKQNESTKKITVTKGLESDYYVGISGKGLSEGLQVVLPTDETSSDTDTDKKESKDSSFPSDFKQDSMKSAPDQGGPGGGAPGGMGGDRGGNYELDGICINEANDKTLSAIRNQKIGFIFQTYQLLPRTTSLSNVELPLLHDHRTILWSLSGRKSGKTRSYRCITL